MATPAQPLNLGSLPAAPSGALNVAFQADAPTPPPTAVIRNSSAYVTFAYDTVIYFPVLQSSATQEIFRKNVRHNENYPANFSGTIAAVERELLSDGLVLRYRTESGADGLPSGEGVFLACSFWLADAYQLQGRDAEANAMFDRLLRLRNDIGLLSEEYDTAARRQVGNFPQAFSHLALIRTALSLHDGEPVGVRLRDTASESSRQST